MTEKARILVVDDDVFMQEMVGEILNEDFDLVFTTSGEDALMVTQTERPDILLLDVELPGMDGYETCRRIKEADDTAGTPVIFISGHDLIENRLKGYEAGGQDYVTKPFDPLELKAKVVHLLNLISERTSLKEMANYATSTAMTAMTSMSEMGALLESLKNFNACTDRKSLADAILAGLAQFGLQGAAQCRSQEGVVTRGNQGEASPLELSVINHMASMERIVQFKSRMSINYPHVSLLVNDMPVEDLDRCGRLRDHLAMLVEGAEARAQAIIAEMESHKRDGVIKQTIVNITDTLREIDSAQRQSRIDTGMAVSVMTDKMENALLSVGLTEAQDRFLGSIVSEGIDGIIAAQSAEIDLQNKLGTVIKELKHILTR